MLRKLGSPDALMDVSLCAYVIRMLCYAMLPALRSPWCVAFTGGKCDALQRHTLSVGA